jgi:hypothetical protein
LSFICNALDLSVKVVFPGDALVSVEANGATGEDGIRRIDFLHALLVHVHRIELHHEAFQIFVVDGLFGIQLFLLFLKQLRFAVFCLRKALVDYVEWHWLRVDCLERFGGQNETLVFLKQILKQSVLFAARPPHLLIADLLGQGIVSRIESQLARLLIVVFKREAEIFVF